MIELFSIRDGFAYSIVGALQLAIAEHGCNSLRVLLLVTVLLFYMCFTMMLHHSGIIHLKHNVVLCNRAPQRLKGHCVLYVLIVN
jgi:hypothetical protein